MPSNVTVLLLILFVLIIREFRTKISASVYFSALILTFLIGAFILVRALGWLVGLTRWI